MFNISSPFLFVDNSLSCLVDDLNPNSKQLEDPLYLSSYYHLPSPLIYNEFDNFEYFLSHNHHDDLATIPPTPLNASSSVVTDDSSIKAGNKMDSNLSGVIEDGCNIKDAMKPSPTNRLRKRRTSKKDRHSKINTAHGLRDRRMRLSLEVARPFFKLQDMLGYDKASRTVEWLLVQSKSAIEELLQSNNIKDVMMNPSGVTTKCTMSSTSDCEVESIVIEEKKGDCKGKKAASTSGVAKDKPKQRRKITTKESRDEARARARKRTQERKMQSKGVQDDEKLPNSSPWGAIEMMMEDCNDSNIQSHKGSNHHVQNRVASPLTIFGN